MSDAPRVTPTDIEANIEHVFFFTAYQGVHRALVNDPAFNMCFEEAADHIPDSLKLLTMCVIVTKSGFTITGESACVSAANFNAELGREISKKNAIDKLWGFMGYHLRETIHQASARSADQAERSEAKVEDGEHDAVGTGEAEAALVSDLESAAEHAEFIQTHHQPKNTKGEV